MYCTKCGSRISEESEYCAQCGCRLQTESPSKKQKQDQTPPSPKSKPEAKENIPMGILGALLGAVVWMILTYNTLYYDLDDYIRINRTSGEVVVGIFLFLCVFGGYCMLAKDFNFKNFSIMFCFLVIFIAPYFIEQLYWIFTCMEERDITFLKACTNLDIYVSHDEYVSSLWNTYYYSCAFPALFFIFYIISLFRQKFCKVSPPAEK